MSSSVQKRPWKYEQRERSFYFSYELVPVLLSTVKLLHPGI